MLNRTAQLVLKKKNRVWGVDRIQDNTKKENKKEGALTTDGTPSFLFLEFQSFIHS